MLDGMGRERPGWSETERPRHARLLDSEVTGDEVVLHLLVGPDVRSLAVPGAWAAGLRPGDLLELTWDVAGRPVGLGRVGGAAPGAWDPQGDALRWRLPGSPRARASLLRQRHEVVRALRCWFEAQGFLEIQAPLLVRGTCPDAFLDSLAVGDRYLVTSTEYQIKRLVAGGLERVFTLTQNFRPGDLGPRHNPEFTMLEWARSFADLAAIEEDAEGFVRAAFQRLHPGASLDLPAGPQGEPPLCLASPWPRQTLRDALGEHLGLDLAADFSLPSLVAEAERLGLALPPGCCTDRVTMLSLLLDLLQPSLGRAAPLWLHGWPAFLTSSARERVGMAGEEDGELVERSELFVRGLELADGFPFQVSPDRQQEAFARQQRQREEAGKEPVTLDARYLEALRQGLPPGAGMALGVDRLVMILTGEQEIRNVMAFGWEEV